jgi:small subunit ribosomal protein S16
MSVKIRLRRQGRSHHAFYHIVAADARSPRDGRFIEKLGTYDPHLPYKKVYLNHERALYWLGVGAEPTDTTASILSKEGVLLRHHLKRIGKSQEEIDAAYSAWKSKADAKVEAEINKLNTAKAEAATAALNHEREVRKAYQTKLQAKLQAPAAGNEE